MQPTTLETSRAPRGGALAETAAFFDEFAATEHLWERRRGFFRRLIASITRFVVSPGAAVLEIGCGSGELLAALAPSRGVGVDVSPRMVEKASEHHAGLEFVCDAGETFVRDEQFDYVVFSGVVPFADDLLAMFRNAAQMTHPRSRIVIHSYSQLWRPLVGLAELLRLKPSTPMRNWVAPADVRNLLDLAGFEVVSSTGRILFPLRVPLLSTFLNGVLANIWPFTYLTLTYWVIARPRRAPLETELDVSVIVPCRNEAGTIAEIVERVPEMGGGTEIVFVEGGSTDDTRAEIERQIELHPDRRLSLHVQTGRGKGDAVRLGFERAQGEIMMILDADLTVAPEDLPKFHDALVGGRAELVNGSRLVYDIESGSMQFLNIFGNKAFSIIFSFLIGQFVKDTLCGTKALFRGDYDAIAAGRPYFGDFDPFGDFDLLLGSARLGLKITDLPVRYGTRRYGTTNISRFQHGLLLLRMTALAFWKLKVEPVRV